MTLAARGGGVLAGLLGLALLLGGCDDLRERATAIVVLHDISGSYFRELRKNLATNKLLLAPLRSRDTMAVARISECSFTDDALVTRLTVADRPSTRNAQISETAGILDAFGAQARPTTHTDIRGALLQASSLLGQARAARRFVVIFSDMLEELPPTCRRDASLAIDLNGIEVVATNVVKLESDNRDPRLYQRRLEDWKAFVERQGGHFQVISDPRTVPDLLRRR